MGVVTFTVDDMLAARLESLPPDRRRDIDATLAAQLSHMLAPKLSMSERAARARQIAAMTPKGIEQTDSTLLIREDRDR
jgi:antitoxin FitA